MFASLTKTRLPFILFLIFVSGMALFVLLNGLGLEELKKEIHQKFDGQKWDIPASVYARPLELFPNKPFTADRLEKELLLAGYRNEKPITAAGGYYREGDSVFLTTREFHFPEEKEATKWLRAEFHEGKLRRLIDQEKQAELLFARLDPIKIGSFHPLLHEDRIVLLFEEIPELLRNGLIVTEDQNFYSHHGISPFSIIRALFANIKAGRTVQGGSTITQQLIKNFFLNNQRTLSRKIKEAIMAILLEMDYSKEEILTAYVNEVFLGQDGSRAIHGFGLASQFYFQRQLDDLTIGQTALLVGMIKGPSAYDPRKNKADCKARRDVVLQLFYQNNLISKEQLQQAKEEPILEIKRQRNGLNRFPAYLDLVRNQLKTEYKEEDLKSRGLKIFTNLNPQVQLQIEETLSNASNIIKQGASQPELAKLQSAVVVTSRETGEVEGLAGDRFSKRGSFNRALNATRPIGSLVKPAVYLTALSHGYTLASPLLDKALTIKGSGNSATNWFPKNYDNKEHGVTPLYLALAKSYNLATVRLGMAVGLEAVAKTLTDMGSQVQTSLYPSLLLGSVELSPFQVAQLYQTISSGGFYLPLRAISSVMTQDNRLLTRYGLDIEQRFSPSQIYLLTHCLERVFSEGTGKNFQPDEKLKYYAGKTGTSNDLKDSWFAGFTSSHVGVVWLGRDDNRPAGLTGSTGALPVWSHLFDNMESERAIHPVTPPEEIIWAQIDLRTLRPTARQSNTTTKLPFLADTVPRTQSVSRKSKSNLNELERQTKKFFNAIQDFFQ